MNRPMILDFLNTDFNFSPCEVIKQHWTHGTWSYKNIPRPDHAIMLLLNGRIDFVSENQTLSAKSGDIVFLPKNSHYIAHFHGEAEPISDYLINFDSPSDFPDNIPPTRLFDNASYQCAELCEQLVTEKISDNQSDLRTKGLFFLFLDAVVSMQKKENSALHSILDKAQNLLKSNDEISIPEIAHACCISESSLRRLFLEHLGISPVKYRLQSKLNRAMYLLDSTNMSINEIAASLNFYDTAYFCKVFRANIGMTPSQYLKNKKL